MQFEAEAETPFTGDDAKPKWIPNHSIIVIAPFRVHIGAFREEFLKPFVYALALLVLMAFTGLGVRNLFVRRLDLSEAQARWAGMLATLCAFAGFAGLQQRLHEQGAYFKRYDENVPHFPILR